MPRAAHELALAHDLVVARPVGLRQADDLALAERAAGVRATVGERVELAGDVEQADLAALHGDELAVPGATSSTVATT